MTKAKRPKGKPPLPSKAEIMAFVEREGGHAGKREIARAFGLKGDRRIALKALLKELAAEGALVKRQKKLQPKGALPPIAVIEIVGADADGEVLAQPLNWEEETPPPRIVLAPAKGGEDRLPAIGPGERALARLSLSEEGAYEARIVRRLEIQANRFVAIYNALPGGMGRLEPTDKKARHDFAVDPLSRVKAEQGDIVLAEATPGRGAGARRARVLERFGHIDDARAISLISIATHGVPHVFPEAALAEAKAAKPVSKEGREDLTHLPLVTIDPEDARDHDDAVFAEEDDDAHNPGGWHVVVAIADVAHYVKPGGALDREAYRRGNSVYFPDRVAPMLPEALSADLCSLVPGEIRPCMAAEMWFDKAGRRLRHRFIRGAMRSAASLTYEQVERAHEGAPDEATRPLLETAIAPLYAAFAALDEERASRAPLDLDLPERKIEIDEAGHVASIAPRARLQSHRLVEEFMIAANVAAAEELEKRRAPCLYRIHDRPTPEKLKTLGDFLQTLDLKLMRTPAIRPLHFNGVLRRVAGTDQAELVSEVILRSQAQAEYAAENIGHFGLNLPRYAHFTSPIRRYSDLVVHRALIRALGLGKDGLTDGEMERFSGFGEHLSMTERRAVAAERDATGRYLAAFMADRVGAVLTGRVSGVTRFGLFVTLDETGADGLVPMRALGDDYYRHDERRHALIGDRSGKSWRLGDKLAVRIAEADGVTGSLRFDLVDRDAGEARPRGKGRPPPPRRGKRRR